MRRKALPLLVFLAIAAGGALQYMPGEQAHAVQKTPLAIVKVKPAASAEVVDWEEYSGRLEALEQVDVRPRVAGTIAAVHFNDGERVKEGQLLFTIDPTPFEIELERKRAVLAQKRDRAQFTKKEFERGKRLLDKNVIARRDFDLLQSNAREARSAMQAAQAAVKRAELDMAYTRVVAPIAGNISRAEITKGNVVTAGGDAPALALIVSQSPIYASFNADERTYLRYFGARASADTTTVKVGLAGEKDYPHRGKLFSVDNHLDTRSGTIRMRALLSNDDGLMIPGLQARV